ncbi:MAG: putative metal-binding motif-containing protein [Myxococcota bacterium]|nr:putative metal-binding motif-containing protein [Myxococcota bacterium]
MSRCTAIFLGLFLLLGCDERDPRDDDDAPDCSAAAVEASLCNGQQDVGEFVVDDLYDVDGDGYFDGSDCGCLETYPTEELDCDDGDAFVNPGATEVHCDGKDNDCDPATIESSDNDMDGYTDCEGDCDDTRADSYPGAPEVECDGVDQDCDGLDAGEGCAVNYAGSWALDSEVAYSCEGLAVGFSAFELNQSGQAVQIDTENCSACDGPGPLTGAFISETQFDASGTQNLSGDCSVVFGMLVTFLDSDSLSGNFTLNFAGAGCGGLGCSGQLISFGGGSAD